MMLKSVVVKNGDMGRATSLRINDVDQSSSMKAGMFAISLMSELETEGDMVMLVRVPDVPRVTRKKRSKGKGKAGGDIEV